MSRTYFSRGANMANHFVKASFVLTVTEAEAEVLRQIEDATGILDDSGFEQDDLAAAYAALGESFTSCFPSTEADPFGGFRAIFRALDSPLLRFSLPVDPYEDWTCVVLGRDVSLRF